MNKEKLTFHSENRNFFVEPSPDNSGVRFIETTNDKTTCVSMIVDNGDDFLLASRRSKTNGILIRSFMPTAQLLLRDGSEPPLDDDQIEVFTPHGKKMIVRPLSTENPESGVIVAYEEDCCLWSVAMCGAPEDGLVVSLSE